LNLIWYWPDLISFKKIKLTWLIWSEPELNPTRPDSLIATSTRLLGFSRKLVHKYKGHSYLLAITTTTKKIFNNFVKDSSNLYYLYYYIKHLRIGRSIFCHGNFLLYLYPSIKRIIFIFGWSNVCDRIHWSPLSLHFFPIYTIISIILLFLFSNLVHIW
jgi:hypothetical protein